MSFCTAENLVGCDMKVEKTALAGVLELTPNRYGDQRGFFSETYNKAVWEGIGIDIEFVQDNHSKSQKAGTLRGLHFQAPPKAQDKLIRVVTGAILDVAVDIRIGSPTFGKWIKVELSANNGKQLFVPKGFLHGFLTLTEATEVVYKCSDFYAPDCDGAVRFDDPAIGIDWGWDCGNLLLSDKDANAASFETFESPFHYEET